MRKIILVIAIFCIIISASVSIQPSSLEHISIQQVNTPEFVNDHYEEIFHNQRDLIITDGEYDTEYSSDPILSIIEQGTVGLITHFIEDITSFGPRRTTTDACKDAGKYIFQQMTDLGLLVSYHNWSSSSSLYGSNIEAILPGVDSANEEVVIVCAHYDSVAPSPGADDNGAGTAAVLAAATIMSQYTFNHTIRFLTFDGEEQGLHGSRYYAQHVYENEDPIVAVLNLDMMGYASNPDSESKVVVFDNEESTWLTDLTASISVRYNEVLNLEVVHGGYSGRSDHASFHGAGIDAIFYFEYEVNPFYHTSSDTLENMNPSYASNVTKLMLGTLAELAEFVPQQAPLIPTRPQGPLNGRIDVEYEYTTSVIDPNADEVYVMWDWGDDSTSDWLGPFTSGEVITTSRSWEENGDFEIKVQAKDEHNQESGWSDPLSISMPKNKNINTLLIRFLEEHPIIYELLQMVLKV
ncbi:MAG: Zn-dependent exopeptidase M28 [Thermoplasmata archaeon]|nr:MAG: Zn-dependent exopeptidase M28 [Thermoplasmata archaeon]